MSCIVSGVVTFKALGLPPDFIGLWLNSWVFAWLVAFPSALVAGPLARKIVARVTSQG